MAKVPDHIEKLLKVNAHPRFYVRWVDRLDEIYDKINQWIDRSGLDDDREEMQKIAAWVVPYLCSDPSQRPLFSDMDTRHFREEWKHILDDLECMYKNETLYGWLGVGQSDLEHKINIARKQYQHPVPRRGSRRRILDQGLEMLFWRLEEIDRDRHQQEFAALELFKVFCFSGFEKMPTAKAYQIVHRIRSEAFRHPRLEVDLLKLIE